MIYVVEILRYVLVKKSWDLTCGILACPVSRLWSDRKYIPLTVPKHFYLRVLYMPKYFQCEKQNVFVECYRNLFIYWGSCKSWVITRIDLRDEYYYKNCYVLVCGNGKSK